MRKHQYAAPKFVYKYPNCGRSYNTEGHLNEHMKQHQLGRSLSTLWENLHSQVKSALKSHLLSCPKTPGGPPAKKFKCDVCGKSYFRSGELARHRRDKQH